MKYIIDTNAILVNPEIINHHEVVVLDTVLQEIETLELKKSNTSLQFEIRNAKRIIYEAVKENKLEIVEQETAKNKLKNYSDEYADNIILSYAIENGLGIITNDVLMILKARVENIQVISPMFDKKDSSGYQGITDFYINHENDQEAIELLGQIEMSLKNSDNQDYFKENFDLKDNQYLIFWDKSQETYKIVNGEEVKTGYKELCVFKYRDGKFKRLTSRDYKINSVYEKITARNTRQKCAIDMLKDKDTKVKALFGTFGAGKDYLMLGQALSLVKDPSSHIDKIVWVRNNVEVKNSNPIGFLPNGLEEKLMPFLMPLVDHLGGEREELEEMLESGQIEIQHLGYIRGRDIKNAIIYVTEVQSNTTEHIQLLIGRVGEGSEIWFNGDDQQTDSDKFKYDNGVRALKKLSGHPLYGQVTLDRTERSEVARMSELIDEN